LWSSSPNSTLPSCIPNSVLNHSLAEQLRTEFGIQEGSVEFGEELHKNLKKTKNDPPASTAKKKETKSAQPYLGIKTIITDDENLKRGANKVEQLKMGDPQLVSTMVAMVNNLVGG
jgi:hypothetical protein